ncbi:MAG: IS110 family transposase [Rhodococcus sp. (in: high G+C Gram-positive bacteria)]
MDVIVECCAGLDVGKKQVQACVRGPDGAAGRRCEVRTFDTFTDQLEALAGWLSTEGVTQVAMEATGPYWKPIWYVLEDAGFELLLVNSRHVKILPGRKTDVGDAAWLAELLEHGLLRGSFIPPDQVRKMRDVTRYRKKLIQAHTAECQRIQKNLEDALLTELRGRMCCSGGSAPNCVATVPARARVRRFSPKLVDSCRSPARRAPVDGRSLRAVPAR